LIFVVNLNKIHKVGNFKLNDRIRLIPKSFCTSWLSR
jgi:hypothetical protein